MKKLFIFLTLIICIQASGQNQADSIRQRVVVDLAAQYYVFPQEKIYLQTDRPYYMNGEKIFFRTFLLNASNNNPFGISRYVYVELLSPIDSVVLRQQIRVDDDRMFHGALLLPENLPEGDYRIRSYTRYMGNIDESWFYSRPVFIADPNAAKADIETEFEFLSDKQVGVNIRFKDLKTKKIQTPESVELQLNANLKRLILNPDAEGWVSAKIDIKESDPKRMLLVQYKDGQHSFDKYIRIPNKEITPDVTFYPEGGNLIAGHPNQVAFKALLSDGKTTEIKGTVYNSKNEQLANFESQHDGMGVFTLNVLPNESYYAQYSYNEQTYKVNLPQVKTDVYGLHASWENDGLLISVLKPETLNSQKCYLLVHHQGIPTYFETWDFSKKEIKLDKAKFTSGVSHLMFLTGDFRTVSERLVFNNLYDAIQLDVQKKKEKIYKPREQVALDIRLLSNNLDTIPASFAISITDDKDVKIDTTTNIMAEILLVSELEGRINNPAWYFENNEGTFEAADLLMLTHGWRRYHVEEALLGNLQKPSIKPELTQSFSGMLKGLLNRPYKNGKIRMTAVGYGFTETVESDDKGRYLFTNFEFPDSTAYHFLTYTNKNTTNIEIIPDKITYPPVSLLWNNPENNIKKAGNDDYLDYILKANMKYIQENGVRMNYLDEVTIKGTQKKKEKKRYDNHLSVGMTSNKWISSDNIKEFPPVTFEDLFWRLPGITEISPSSGVVVRGGAASFVLNGRYLNCTFDELSSFVNVSDIAQVDLFTETAQTISFSSKGGAVIVLTTWPPGSEPVSAGDQTHMKTIMPLGYQQPIEFYSPKYETLESLSNQNQDLRSTIYWKPNVMVNENAKASVDFYTADTPTTYSVVIEGVGNNKKLIHYRKEALIKVEK